MTCSGIGGQCVLAALGAPLLTNPCVLLVHPLYLCVDPGEHQFGLLLGLHFCLFLEAHLFLRWQTVHCQLQACL
jgi:hypothetical protein